MSQQNRAKLIAYDVAVFVINDFKYTNIVATCKQQYINLLPAI